MKRSLVLASVLLVSLGWVVPSSAQIFYGSISGRVTDAAASPLAGICVSMHQYSEYYYGYQTTTDADGRYRFDYVASGSYKVRFMECSVYYFDLYYDPYDAPFRTYLTEWFDDKPDFQSADAVTVQDLEETAGIDAALARGGRIAGLVTGESGFPVSGICVGAFASSGAFSAGRRSSLDGTYVLSGLASGTYRISFSDCDARVYAPEWWNDEASVGSADPVDVSVEMETAGIDAVLSKGGGIHGRVTDAPGNPISGICVSAADTADGGQGGWSQTGSAGTYVIGGLRAGTYKVQFVDCASGASWLGEWWNDRPDAVGADPVAVTLGAITDGIDAVLTPGPVVDLAVTGLSVQEVPLQTDHATLPPSGWVRDVVVEVANHGTTRTPGTLYVQVCTPTDAACTVVGQDFIAPVAGETVSRAFRWNGFGSVGDVEIKACAPYVWDDVTPQDNTARIDHYVVVGGAGLGMQILPADGGWYWRPCDSVFFVD